MGNIEQIHLSDGVIALTPLSLADVDAHLAGEDDELVRWLSGGPGTRAGTAAYVRHCRDQWATGGALRAFGIRAGEAATLAGTIDVRLAMPGWPAGEVNIAYGLYPQWRGGGLATRAVELICRYAASEGAAVGVIRVEPDNPASAAVARRTGFTHAGQGRDADGTLLDRYVRDLRA
ncbi:GNAT family N-acetyltransferase [Streptomyces sp. NPDC059063]|uniref:GNAT family N-acetyltransferase n=1 Tax=unclassified Streptomyces TaxID=2593676 RepID=UPI003686AE14